jgi:glycogen debranching enzyme
MNSLSSNEWLESDGLGGFAAGTASTIRTRRYHALLLTATTPPTGRLVLVNGFDAWVETPKGRFSLSSQCYAPGVVGDDGASHIESFTHAPWPCWIFKVADGTRVQLELFAVHGEPLTCLTWKLLGDPQDVKLFVRPFLSGRDYHSLHKANGAFQFEADMKPGRVTWQPYAGVPGVTALTTALYEPDPHWYHNFLYTEERARGLDCVEDLAAPGVFSWHLADREAVLVLTTKTHAETLAEKSDPVELAVRFRARELARRQQFPSQLHAAADAYIVRGRLGTTIIAGYPWFADWGRDTLIALRGLCLATGRLSEAREILLTWAGTVSEGMLPNRFPDQGDQPEFNAVDASLWFVIAVHEYLQLRSSRREEAQFKSRSNGAMERWSNHAGHHTSTIPSLHHSDEEKLLAACDAILEGYAKGTRFNIKLDSDGLIACGEPGVQLTWMDAKVGDWVVTPRIGKPVEIQALWLNALSFASKTNPKWSDHFARGLESFRRRFWNDARRCLFDVVDVNHQAGINDPAIRPNQIFAIGGLPVSLFEDERARLILESVEDNLLTPLGLRSLAASEPGYVRRYEGGVRERDGAYHQGTVWPWLVGPFVEAWVRVRGSGPTVRKEAREKFLKPLLEHLNEAGLGHVSEIADAESPHVPRGCPFQAWSVGELLRLDQVVLRVDETKEPGKSKRRRSDSVAASRQSAALPAS